MFFVTIQFAGRFWTTVKYLYTTVKNLYILQNAVFVIYWFLMIYKFGTAIAMPNASSIINLKLQYYGQEIIFHGTAHLLGSTWREGAKHQRKGR